MENDLLADIRRFLEATGMSPLYFGKEAVGNSELVPRLERGRTITLRTANTLRAFMAANRNWRPYAAKQALKRRHRKPEAREGAA